MLNQLVMVGRIAKELLPEEGTERVVMTLAVPRTFKNDEGIYETDFINVSVNGGIAKNVQEYCKKGDLVGIRGRIQGNENGSLEIIADKLTFLSSRKVEDEEA